MKKDTMYILHILSEESKLYNGNRRGVMSGMSGNLFQNWNIDELYRQKRFFTLYGTFFPNFRDFLG